MDSCAFQAPVLSFSRQSLADVLVNRSLVQSQPGPQVRPLTNPHQTSSCPMNGVREQGGRREQRGTLGDVWSVCLLDMIRELI